MTLIRNGRRDGASVIAEIGEAKPTTEARRHGGNPKIGSKTLPLINTDDTDQELKVQQRGGQTPRLPKSPSSPRSERAGLTILPIQQFAHCLAAGFVRFLGILVLGAARAATGRGIGSVRLTACRTAVGKAGLVRLELKLF